jgi:hypothetical protein
MIYEVKKPLPVITFEEVLISKILIECMLFLREFNLVYEASDRINYRKLAHYAIIVVPIALSMLILVVSSILIVAGVS